MNETVFLTVMSCVATLVVGQLVVKLVIEPVQGMKEAIALVSDTMIERANIFQNLGCHRKR